MSTHGTFTQHPCFFISSKLRKILGGYDLRYKYASDFDYILRALAVKNIKGKHLNTFISKFRIHGMSITASGKTDSERKEILRQHGYFQFSYVTRLYFYYTMDILQNNKPRAGLQRGLTIEYTSYILLLLYIFTMPFVSAFAFTGTISLPSLYLQHSYLY